MRPVRPWNAPRPSARRLLPAGPARLRAVGVLLLPLLAVTIGAASAGAIPEKSNGRLPGENVTFLSRFSPAGGRTSDIWGYTAPDGREYALVGNTVGISVVDITNRRRPRETEFLERPASGWRDIKTYRNYMYSVNEGAPGPGGNGGGLGIFDLSDPESPRRVAPYRAFSTAHNLYVDEAAGLAFIAGSDQVGGVIILSLADPERPVQVAVWSSPYAHDVFARDGLMYVSAIWDAALWIVDISDLDNMSLVTRVANYRDAFTHNAWTTADGSHVMTTDEKSGARCRMWSLADPAVQSETGVYSPPGAARAIPHNVLIDGDLAYISHYTAGVRVVDVSDPTNLREYGYYDTVPANNWALFDGAWGVFPFYPNSPGLFVVSDIGRGLFVFRLQRLPGTGDGSGEGPAQLHGDAAGHVVIAAPDRFPGADSAPRMPFAGDVFPNPVRAGDAAALELAPAPGVPVDARVFDAAGRLVRTLSPGVAPRVTWDGRTGSGKLVAPGVYFLSIRTGAVSETRRVHVIR